MSRSPNSPSYSKLVQVCKNSFLASSLIFGHFIKTPVSLFTQLCLSPHSISVSCRHFVDGEILCFISSHHDLTAKSNWKKFLEVEQLTKSNSKNNKQGRSFSLAVGFLLNLLDLHGFAAVPGDVLVSCKFPFLYFSLVSETGSKKLS